MLFEMKKFPLLWYFMATSMVAIVGVTVILAVLLVERAERRFIARSEAQGAIEIGHFGQSDGFIRNDFLTGVYVGIVTFNGQDPAVHFLKNIPHVRIVFGVAPQTTYLHDLVIEMSIGGTQACSGRKLVYDHVDVAVLGVVCVTAIVDDRGTGQARAAIKNATGFQCSPTRLNVGPVAGGYMIHIAVEATDIPVQIDELLGRNDLIIECR